MTPPAGKKQARKTTTRNGRRPAPPVVPTSRGYVVLLQTSETPAIFEQIGDPVDARNAEQAIRQAFKALHERDSADGYRVPTEAILVAVPTKMWSATLVRLQTKTEVSIGG